jgi:hypothetical protein
MSTLTNVNEKVIAQMALEAFTDYLTPVDIFSTDYSDEAKKKGDTVVVPLIATFAAATFNSDYETTGGNMSSITVNLTDHCIVPADISDIQAGKSSMAKLENFGRLCGQALAQKVLTNMWTGLLTTANFGNAVVTAQTWTITQLRAVRKALNNSRCPMEGRSLVLGTNYVDHLLADSNFLQAQLYGSREAIVEGKISRALGMSIYESAIVPLNSISLVGFACHKGAIAAAFRYVQPLAPDMYQSAGQVVAENGLSIGYRTHYSLKTGKMFFNVETLFGYTAALTHGLKLITDPSLT